MSAHKCSINKCTLKNFYYNFYFEPIVLQASSKNFNSVFQFVGLPYFTISMSASATEVLGGLVMDVDYSLF